MAQPSYEKISLKDLEKIPNIFSDIARENAFQCYNKDKNKPAQLRQFYDELVMWDEKISSGNEQFARALPFIQMMRAKVAYSFGRGKVTKEFRDMFDRVISQIDSEETLRHAKLFMEAFMGYLKYRSATGNE